MESVRQVVFGPFRLDPLAKRLWCGAQEVALQPQPLAVLHYLVMHAGRVVTKEELLTEVWAGTHVTKTALKVCVHAIRVALGDSAATPRYRETIGWRGRDTGCTSVRWPSGQLA
jgi:DNA-binding winged helix-turn-helix (wHTH) protein